MTYYRGRGRPAKQSGYIPPDGFVTVNVDSLRDQLNQYMQQQAPNISLAMALRDLLEMALAVVPEDSAIHQGRRDAYRDASRYIYRSLSAYLPTLMHDLQNTAVLLEPEGNQTDGY